MSEKKENSTATEVVVAVVEHGVTAAAAIGGTAVGGPVGGLVAGGATKGILAGLKRLVGRRAEKRAEDYARELEAAIVSGHVERLAEFEDSEHFNEVVFQTFRKTMDALCPAVVPALARLAAYFKDLPLDPLFRGLGRTLQDIEDDTLYHTLRVIFSAAVKAADDGGDRVDLEARTDDGPHLHIVVDPRRTFSDKWGLHSDRAIFRCPLGAEDLPRLDAVLLLLERHGLCHADWGRSSRWEPAASFEFDVTTCRRALEVLGLPEVINLCPVEIHPFAVASEAPGTPDSP